MIGNGNGHGSLVAELPSIDPNGFRLGSVDGFYPVEPIGDEKGPQAWLPRGLQAYESLVLAQHIADSGVEYDAVIGLSRGAGDIASTVAYYNGIKHIYYIQTDGYDENNNELEVPRIISTPDPETVIKKGKHGGLPRFLKVDDLADKLGSMMVTDEWVANNLTFDILDNGVIYDKVQPRKHKSDIRYTVRPVRNIWIDHESQARGARRAQRMEELKPYAGEIAATMGWLATQQVDPSLIPTMVAKSVIASDIQAFQVVAGH